ncbi:hypothetical protein MCOR30_010329 [Pyricularia oryzae]|nr:hypothetical protein MCOR30_010329 [Pyricularia oryzae]KAI6429416.1 hypothetical protein MCOR24_002190 [Pyricularia oryzae]KAI6446234.1 hypothetical protein MCOR22_003924 [Pyricularia oryzae]KAI6489400.1 hypothetical protein MCOR11_007937 [Pyricularia oryzae]KAI6535744.1 hypothetical protein MCOR05_005901 [Pyricularia oryzae]
MLLDTGGFEDVARLLNANQPPTPDPTYLLCTLRKIRSNRSYHIHRTLPYTTLSVFGLESPAPTSRS